MRDASNAEEWKRIAEKVTKEADSEKLALLVKELCGVDPQAGTRPKSERSFR